MSHQAGQATSTDGDHSLQPGGPLAGQQQQQQHTPGPSATAAALAAAVTAAPGTIELSAQQQAILQQFAARNAGNPAAAPFFANLPNLTLPQNRKTSASSTTAAPTNGNSPAAAASASTLPSTSGSSPSAQPGQQPDVASLQAQLQARLIQSQQQAMQAAALRGAGGQTMQPGQQQQQQQQQQQGGAAAPTGGPPKPPNGLPDWAAAAAANGMLNLGTDREAIMKQLQALHASHQQRAKHAPGIAVPSPVNPGPAAASPASVAAPSPAGGSVSAPSPAATIPTPLSTSQLLPADAASAPSPGIMSALAQAVRQPATPTTPGPAGPAGPAGVRPPGGMPPGGGQIRQPMLQKQQLLNSIVAFYRQTNQPLPTEVFNGERDGAFKLGGNWVELTEMFVMVFRLGGMTKLLQGNIADHAVWQAILASKNIPVNLPEAVALPRQPGQDPSAPPQMTTSAVQYLVAAYRAWIFAFEQAMARSKLAAFQKQQAMAAAAGGTPRPPLAGSPAGPTPPGGPPSVATPETAGPRTPATLPAAPSPQASFSAPSPAVVPAPSPAVAAPTPPVISAPSPAAVAPAIPTPAPVQAPTPTAPPPAPIAPSHVVAEAPVAPPKPKLDLSLPSAAAPSPTVAEAPPAAAPSPVNGGGAMKRKSSTPASAVATPVSAVPSEPRGPKRARYKVEYRPLHFPQPSMGGWDERTIASAFPKHNLGRPTRSLHELQVDVESVLMGLRSRIPTEIGYGLTVLSMLSMPLHDGQVNSLPIEPLIDVYLEVLDLVAEAALGEDGVDGWLKEQAAAEKDKDKSTTTPRASASRDFGRLSYAQLEQLGRDFDFKVEDDDAEFTGPQEQTGGRTDIVFAGLNIIRNFSLFEANRARMARPELFNVLAAVTDQSLARLPGERDSVKPYSILELARVRRDAVSIIANLGQQFDLRLIPHASVLSVFRLLASFLASAWECNRSRDPGFGPCVSIRDVPPVGVLSIDRALEAFCRLALLDHNREVFAAVVPGDELVALFAGLIKLFPLSARDVEAMHSIEDYLGRVELIALCVYSLAFLAPLPARAGMRSTSGATALLTRLVFDLTPRAADLKASAFGSLVRRVAETLGVLNGTVNPGGMADRMSFSAGGVDGKGWRFASEVVQPGWLAHDAERLLESMGWGRGDRCWRVDPPTFAELDGLWCG